MQIRLSAFAVPAFFTVFLFFPCVRYNYRKSSLTSQNPLTVSRFFRLSIYIVCQGVRNTASVARVSAAWRMFYNSVQSYEFSVKFSYKSLKNFTFWHKILIYCICLLSVCKNWKRIWPCFAGRYCRKQTAAYMKANTGRQKRTDRTIIETAK